MFRVYRRYGARPSTTLYPALEVADKHAISLMENEVGRFVLVRRKDLLYITRNEEAAKNLYPALEINGMLDHPIS